MPSVSPALLSHSEESEGLENEVAKLAQTLVEERVWLFTEGG